MIILNKNLRNTIEIAKWLKNKTKLGHYEDYSGINGFKISRKLFSEAKKAIFATMNTILNKYLKQGIDPEKIVVLSYYKLNTLLIYPDIQLNDECGYLPFKSKKGGKKVFLVEPKTISSMDQIKHYEDIDCDWCIVFKTITAFKGLEEDIIFLLVPELEEFKKNNPEKYENLLMQIYVGASRAKFKLYFFEFEKIRTYPEKS